MRKKKRALLLVFLLLLILTISFYFFINKNTNIEENDNNNFNTNNDNLEIYSLEMKQQYGDSTLIKYGDYEILVDGGDSQDATTVKNALTTYVTDGILDLLIVTHPHSDHVGGISQITTFSSINEIKSIIDTGYDYGVRQIFKFNVLNYYISKGTNYYSINDVMSDNNLKSIKIDDNLELNFLNTKFYQAASTTSNINNTSIAFYIKYFNTIICMTGDAESVCEQSIISLNPKFTTKDNVVIFKAAHHGSRGANSKTFLEYLEPDYCFVSAAFTIDNGEEPNLSQHPYYDAIRRMITHTKNIYWNGINGTLKIIITNENEITITGNGRTKQYSYLDQATNKLITTDPLLEKDITYLQSKWYQVGVEKLGWTKYYN